MEIKQEIAQVQKRPETFADIRKETEARFRELGEAPELLLTNANKIVLPEGLTADKIMAFKDENEGDGK